ncbi:MAG: hypothetical protein Kow0073_06330 [Immundisolibacter sp.]
MPGPPLPDLRGPRHLERLRQRARRQRGRGLAAGGKAERQHTALRQHRHERDVAGTGAPVPPSHAAVAIEILPAVAAAAVAGARRAQRINLPGVHRRQRQAKRPLLGPQHATPLVARGLGAVVVPGAAQMRRQQYRHAKGRVAAQGDLDQQHVTVAIGDDALGEREARMAMPHRHGRHARLGEFYPAVVDTLQLLPETRAVGDDETEVANLRQVDPRAVHLVDDALPDREPYPRVAEAGADRLLGAGAPVGRRARAAGRLVVEKVPGHPQRPGRRRLGTRQARPSRATSCSAASGPQLPAA